MLKGKEVILRYAQSSDLDALIYFANNVELKGEFARGLLKSPVAFKKEFEQNGFSSESNEMFVITDHLNQLLGVIGHFTTAHYSSARELGFSIFPEESKNKGLATEAVKLLTRYLFESLPIHRVQICMPVEHKSCEKVAIKAGYTKEGVARGSIFVKGSYLDTFVFSMLRNEFVTLSADGF